MSNRREFGAAVVATAVLRTAGASPMVERPRKNTLMHVGGDYHSVAGSDITARQNLEYNLRHGVKHLTVRLSKHAQGGWDPEVLQRMRHDCDRYGVVLEAIRMDSDYIRLRKGPDRDREIDTIVGNIRKAAQAGVKVITYNWEVVPYRRNRKISVRLHQGPDSGRQRRSVGEHFHVAAMRRIGPKLGPRLGKSSVGTPVTRRN
jgi:hypothetical protein